MQISRRRTERPPRETRFRLRWRPRAKSFWRRSQAQTPETPRSPRAARYSCADCGTRGRARKGRARRACIKPDKTRRACLPEPARIFSPKRSATLRRLPPTAESKIPKMRTGCLKAEIFGAARLPTRRGRLRQTPPREPRRARCTRRRRKSRQPSINRRISSPRF